jgi:hypothetical protein
MSPSELRESPSGSHLKGLVQVATEVVRRDFVHQVRDRLRRTLSTHLVVAEAPTEGGGKSDGGGRVNLCLHEDPIDLMGLIVLDDGELWNEGG